MKYQTNCTFVGYDSVLEWLLDCCYFGAASSCPFSNLTKFCIAGGGGELPFAVINIESKFFKSTISFSISLSSKVFFWQQNVSLQLNYK